MPKIDPRIDAYIAKTADFAKPILNHLRKLVHAACPEAEETMKWNFPHFMHHGILCSMAAFKQHCTFGFWNGELVLGKSVSRDEAHGQFGRITALSDLPADKTLLAAIKKAARLNETGVKKPAPVRSEVKRELTVPDYFMAALRANKKALAAFEDFSYSHKKEYVEWVVEAKREETRTKRIETALAWLAGGKPRYWKYERC